MRDGDVLYSHVDEEDIGEVGPWRCPLGPHAAFASGATRVVVGCFPMTMGALRTFVLFFRVIWVHSRVGEVDNGFHHAGVAASVDQGASTSVSLAPGGATTDCRGVQMSQGPWDLPFISAVHVEVGWVPTIAVVRAVFRIDGDIFLTRLMVRASRASLPASMAQCMILF